MNRFWRRSSCPTRAHRSTYLANLALEALSERVTPAFILWTGNDAIGAWGSPSNWEGNTVPGPLDTARFKFAGANSNPIVQPPTGFPGTGTVEVGGILMENPWNAPLTIEGTLLTVAQRSLTRWPLSMGYGGPGVCHG